MIDKTKLELSSFLIEDKYKALFLKNKVSFFVEIEDLSFSQLIDLLGCSFSDAVTIADFVDKVKKALFNKEALAKLYNGKICFVEEEGLSVSNGEDIPIKNLELSVRSYNALVAYGIKNLNDLLETSQVELSKIRNLGAKSICEICKLVKAYKEKPISKEKRTDSNSINSYPLLSEISISVRTYNALKHAGYTSLNELLDYSLGDFLAIKNMGYKSAREIYNVILESKSQSINDLSTNLYKNLCELENKIKNYKYKDYSIDKFYYLPKLDYERLALNVEEQTGKIYSLIDLTFKSYFELILDCCSLSLLSKSDIFNIVSFFKLYFENGENLVIDISEKNLYIMERRSLGFTLEEVGKDLSLTRERVRQLEVKTLKKINSIFTENKCKRFFLDDYYVRSRNITSLSDRSYTIFLNIINRQLDLKIIRLNGETYYIKNNVFNEIFNKFNNISEELDKVGILFYNEFDFSILNIEYKDYFLDYFKINANTNCIYKGNRTTDKLLSYIKKYNYIDFSDDNIEILKLSLSQLVDIGDFNKRNLIASLERQGIINIGKSKYSASDILQKIPANVMEEITNFIQVHKIVSSDEICKCYKNQLPDFITPSMVYFFMKDRYSNMFNFGGTTLMISTKDTAASKAVLIFEHIKNSSVPVANVELLDKYKLNKASLSVIVQQNSDIIYLDDVYLWLISKMKNAERIMQKVEFYANKHKSFFAADLYKYILFNNQRMLEQDFITTFERFLKFLKILCKDLLSDYEYDRIKKNYSKKLVEVSSYGFDSEF